MAELRDSHVVEIPVDGAHHQHDQPEQVDEVNPSSAVPLASAAVSAMQHHPLTEISRSPGHLLLLKLWHREEDFSARRVGAVETRMEGAKRDVFRLCCVFLSFHGLFLTLLFAFSVGGRRAEGRRACGEWWVPSCLSLLTSLALVCAVQARLCGYWEASRLLQRERGDSRALARFVRELRMKGASFDLTREPAQGAKRVKSSSVKVRWKKPLRWWRRHLVTVGLLCFTGLAVPTCKFVLCG